MRGEFKMKKQKENVKELKLMQKFWLNYLEQV
jgi:hypothetical protein